MAVNKSTYVAGFCEAAFVSKKPNDDGTASVFMFQGTDYIPDYDMKIPPEAVVGKLSDEELYEFKGSHKFTIPTERLTNEKYKELLALKPRERCILEYAFMPGSFKSDTGRDIKFASMVFMGLRPRRSATDPNSQQEQKIGRPPVNPAA